MDLLAKIRTLPTGPGVYLYKNADGEVIYVGKAKNLRARVRSYFNEERLADAKTDTLIREAADVDYIVLDNDTIKFRRVEYDVEKTIKKIYDIPDLDNFLGDRLGEGR